MVPLGRLSLLLLLAVVLATACAPWQPAPSSGRDSRPVEPERAIESPPTWYRVERGDTLYSIAFRYGLDWRNVARWNGIDAPFTIRPGQELRMSAPPRSRPAAVASRGNGPSPDSSPPQPAEPASERETREPEPAPEPKPAAAETPDRGGTPAGSGPTRSAGGVAWQWPTQGDVTRPFDAAATRKGIGIAGSEGQPVHAAAAGQVVYSGTALIGYGELIIIKHSDKLLSAYGHNRRRLVGEGDRVSRGQKVAEMGRDDRREELLHFEIRRDGEPVNPLDYLPGQ